MTATVSYRTPGPGETGHPPRGPGPEGTLQRARQMAEEVLKLAGIPHHIEDQDHRDNPAQAAEPLYGFYIRLSGDGTMCQPLKYGWTYDPKSDWTLGPGEEPQDPAWTGSHSCITDQARNFSKIHITVSEILRRWEAAGLVEQVKDSTGWHTTRQPRKLAAVHNVTTTSLQAQIGWMQDTFGQDGE